MTGPKFGLDLIINVEQSKELIIYDFGMFFLNFLLPHFDSLF